MGLIYERDEKANVPPPPPPKTGKEGETSHNGDSAFRWRIRIRIMSGSLQNALLDISPGDVGLWVDLPTQFQFLPRQGSPGRPPSKCRLLLASGHYCVAGRNLIKARSGWRKGERQGNGETPQLYCGAANVASSFPCSSFTLPRQFVKLKLQRKSPTSWYAAAVPREYRN